MTEWDDKAFKAGYASFKVGLHIDRNPYDLIKQLYLHDSWQEGWISASQKRLPR